MSQGVNKVLTYYYTRAGKGNTSPAPASKVFQCSVTNLRKPMTYSGGGGGVCKLIFFILFSVCLRFPCTFSVFLPLSVCLSLSFSVFISTSTPPSLSFSPRINTHRAIYPRLELSLSDEPQFTRPILNHTQGSSPLFLIPSFPHIHTSCFPYLLFPSQQQQLFRVGII